MCIRYTLFRILYSNKMILTLIIIIFSCKINHLFSEPFLQSKFTLDYYPRFISLSPFLLTEHTHTSCHCQTFFLLPLRLHQRNILKSCLPFILPTLAQIFTRWCCPSLEYLYRVCQDQIYSSYPPPPPRTAAPPPSTTTYSFTLSFYFSIGDYYLGLRKGNEIAMSF